MAKTKSGCFSRAGSILPALASGSSGIDARVRAFTLDFGAQSVEREQAAEVAKHLEIPLDVVPADGEAVGAALMDLVWKLDLPFGDAVTGPQYLLGRAARAAGLTAVFNGEGGDQLFGGWTQADDRRRGVRQPLRRSDESREERTCARTTASTGWRMRSTRAQFSAAGRTHRGSGAHLLRPYLEGNAADSVSQPRAAGRHLAEGLAEHSAARGAHGQRLGTRRARAAVRPRARRGFVSAAAAAQAARCVREVRAEACSAASAAGRHRLAAGSTA